jgi:gas vesicle protein
MKDQKIPRIKAERDPDTDTPAGSSQSDTPAGSSQRLPSLQRDQLGNSESISLFKKQLGLCDQDGAVRHRNTKEMAAYVDHTLHRVIDFVRDNTNTINRVADKVLEQSSDAQETIKQLQEAHTSAIEILNGKLKGVQQAFTTFKQEAKDVMNDYHKLREEFSNLKDECKEEARLHDNKEECQSKREKWRMTISICVLVVVEMGLHLVWTDVFLQDEVFKCKSRDDCPLIATEWFKSWMSYAISAFGGGLTYAVYRLIGKCIKPKKARLGRRSSLLRYRNIFSRSRGATATSTRSTDTAVTALSVDDRNTQGLITLEEV